MNETAQTVVPISLGRTTSAPQEPRPVLRALSWMVRGIVVILYVPTLLMSAAVRAIVRMDLWSSSFTQTRVEEEMRTAPRALRPAPSSKRANPAMATQSGFRPQLRMVVGGVSRNTEQQ